MTAVLVFGAVVTAILSGATPKCSTVSSRRNSDTAVRPSDCLMEKRVISRNDRSCPTRVMSVPCRVVMIFSGVFSPSISLAIHAEVACGMA